MRVSYLDDFLLRGWGYYATCKRRSAGGWATDDGLFAVVPAYESLDDETFSVRFLAHETQHFADKKTFPNLESWELEYRAKLVELSLADRSQASTLQLICENRTESRASPHGYADLRVVDDLSAHLRLRPSGLCENRMASGQTLRDAAKAVLWKTLRNAGVKIRAWSTLPIVVVNRVGGEKVDLQQRLTKVNVSGLRAERFIGHPRATLSPEIIYKRVFQHL